MGVFSEIYAKVMAIHTVLKICICGVIGIGIGIALSASEANHEWTIWLGMPGTLYLRALQCLVGPLVFCSVIMGFASLGEIGAGGGKIMKTAFGLYMLTTILAIAQGLFLVLITQPAWDKHADQDPNALLIVPTSVKYDNPGRFTIGYEDKGDGPKHPRFNATTASYAHVQYTGQPAATMVGSLSYYYPGRVTFSLPDPISPSGDVYTGSIMVTVFDANGVQVFNSSKASITASGKVERNAISESLEGLLKSITPDNLVGIFYGDGGSASLLSIISFGILFSLALMLQSRVEGTPHALMPFIQELLDTVMIIVMWVVNTTPLAVGSLILAAIAGSSLSDLGDAMSSLGIVVVCCIVVNVFHASVVLPGLAFAFTRKNPYHHLRGMVKAMGVSAGSASSAVTLPVNMECCEALGYDPAIVRFSLSLGATISMDGAAVIFLAISVWLGVVSGEVLTFGKVVILVIIVVLSSMGASPTPGMVSTVMLIFGSVYGTDKEIPVEIGYFAAVDWLLDRFGTTTNILSDSFVVMIMDHLYGEDHKQRASEVQKHIDSTGKHPLHQDLEHDMTKRHLPTVKPATEVAGDLDKHNVVTETFFGSGPTGRTSTSASSKDGPVMQVSAA